MVYKDWDEYVNPNYISVVLEDNSKLIIWKKNVRGGTRVYQAILRAFHDNDYTITDKIVSAMVNNLNK
jgi:ribosomal protein L14